MIVVMRSSLTSFITILLVNILTISSILGTSNVHVQAAFSFSRNKGVKTTTTATTATTATTTKSALALSSRDDDNESQSQNNKIEIEQTTENGIKLHSKVYESTAEGKVERSVLENLKPSVPKLESTAERIVIENGKHRSIGVGTGSGSASGSSIGVEFDIGAEIGRSWTIAAHAENSNHGNSNNSRSGSSSNSSNRAHGYKNNSNVNQYGYGHSFVQKLKRMNMQLHATSRSDEGSTSTSAVQVTSASASDAEKAVELDVERKVMEEAERNAEKLVEGLTTGTSTSTSTSSTISTTSNSGGAAGSHSSSSMSMPMSTSGLQYSTRSTSTSTFTSTSTSSLFVSSTTDADKINLSNDIITSTSTSTSENQNQIGGHSNVEVDVDVVPKKSIDIGKNVHVEKENKLHNEIVLGGKDGGEIAKSSSLFVSSTMGVNSIQMIENDITADTVMGTTTSTDTVEFVVEPKTGSNQADSTSTSSSQSLSSPTAPQQQQQQQYKPFTPLPEVTVMSSSSSSGDNNNNSNNYLDALSTSKSNTDTDNGITQISGTGAFGYMSALESQSRSTSTIPSAPISSTSTGSISGLGGYLNELDVVESPLSAEEKSLQNNSDSSSSSNNNNNNAQEEESTDVQVTGGGIKYRRLKLKEDAQQKANSVVAGAKAALAKAKAEAEEARINKETKEEVEAKAAKLKEAAEAKAKEEARIKAENEAKAIAEAKAREEAIIKAKEEAQAKAAAEAKVREEARIKAKEEAQAKADAEAKAREEAESKAKEEAQAKAAAEAKAREEAESKAKEEAEAKAAAEVRAKEEAELRAMMRATENVAVEDNTELKEKIKAVEEAEAKARKAEEKAEAEAKARKEEQKKAAYQIAKLAKEQKELAQQIREEKEKRREEQKKAFETAAAEAEAAAIIAASKKVESEKSNSEIDEIVAELCREVAENADKKIADWMKGKAEAADVVDALKERASAEDKAKAVAKAILQAKKVQKTLTDTKNAVPKQAVSLFESFFSPKANLGNIIANKEEAAEVPKKNDTRNGSTAHVLSGIDSSAEPGSSIFNYFFGTTQKEDKKETKEKVPITSSLDDLASKKDEEHVNAGEGGFISFFGADLKKDHKKLDTVQTNKSSKHVGTKLELQLDSANSDQNKKGSIFESLFSPKKTKETVANKEVSKKKETLHDEKKEEIVAHKNPDQTSSVFESIFGNSSPSKVSLKSTGKKEISHDPPTKEDEYDIVAVDPLTDAFASFFGQKSSTMNAAKEVADKSNSVEPNSSPEPKPSKSFPLFFAAEGNLPKKQKVEQKKESVPDKPTLEPKLDKKEKFTVFGKKGGSKNGSKGMTFSLFSRDATRLQEEVSVTLEKEARSKTAGKQNSKRPSMKMFGGVNSEKQLFEPVPPPLPKNVASFFEESTKRKSTPAPKMNGKSSSATRAVTSHQPDRQREATKSSQTFVVAKPPMKITKNTNLKHVKQTPPQPKQKIRPGKTFVITKANKTFSTNGLKDDGIPLLTQWKQNKDGTITGKISNSRVFRAGQKIVTSPVKNGAKKGVVTTNSGSKYRLM